MLPRARPFLVAAFWGCNLFHAALAVRRTPSASAKGPLGGAIGFGGLGAGAGAGKLRRRSLLCKARVFAKEQWGWRRLPSRLPLQDGLLFLVLDYLSTRYWLALETGRERDLLQVWEFAVKWRGRRACYWKPALIKARLVINKTIGEGKAYRAAAFARGGSLMVTSSIRPMQLWDVPSRRYLGMRHSYDFIHGVSPDGERVLVGDRESRYDLHNALSRSVMLRVQSFEQTWTLSPEPEAAAFSPDGDLVAMVGRDRVALVVPHPNSSDGYAACFGQLPLLRPERVAVTGQSLMVCGREGHPWEEGRLISYMVRRSTKGCDLVKSQRVEPCADVVVVDGEVFILRVNRTVVSIYGRKGMAAWSVCTNCVGLASALRGAEFSPDGRSVYFWSRRAHMLWPFAYGLRPQALPPTPVCSRWKFSDDGEVLVALADTGPLFVDVPSGLSIWVGLEKGLWPIETSRPRALAMSRLHC